MSENTSKTKALIIVDMLHDFIDPDGALFSGDRAREIIPRVQEIIDEHRAGGSIIIFTADNHAPDDKEFELFPPHCVAGTKGAEVIPELTVEAGDFFVPKTRYSAFFNTDLDDILKKNSVTEAHMVGVCTSICVMETVSDLRNRDMTAVVHADAVADFDPAAHEFALGRMKTILGADVVGVAQ